MNANEIVPHIHRLWAKIDTNVLFEGLWPIPHGMIMNSYVVCGDKTAVIDGVCGWDGVPETLFNQLAECGIALSSIDYAIINHLEPDHTGWLENLIKLNPGVVIVGSKEAEYLTRSYYRNTREFLTVDDNEDLDLGNGYMLKFTMVPYVHWPETMVTYEVKTKTLFTGDVFGSFGDFNGIFLDSQLTEETAMFFKSEALRYYSNIIGPFTPYVKKAMAKLLGLSMSQIAPAHGIVWQDNPGKIIEIYDEFISCYSGKTRELITVVWSTMYGSTEAALESVLKGIKKQGVEYKVFQVPQDHMSFIIQSCWESTGIVLAMPTYESKMFPPMAFLLDELGKKKIRNKIGFHFGSYGWSGGAQKELDEILTKRNMNWDMIEPVEFKGSPDRNDLNNVENSGFKLAGLVKEKVNNMI